MDVQAMLGMSMPLIQAPMAGVQDSVMAIEVSNAGGLGSLPCAMLGTEHMREELHALRTKTTKAYNVNFFAHKPPTPDEARELAWRSALAPYFSELEVDPATIPTTVGRMPFNWEAARVLEEFTPKVVSFHFGLPEDDLLRHVRKWGAKVLATATTLEEALWLEKQGVDAVIAQGLEAGGHRGNFLNDDLTTQMGTMALVPQLVRALKIPVIAAGGITDRASVVAAMRLGASAVQVGTTFLLCPEAKTSNVHRAALQSPAARHTALTRVFTGRPARGIVNRLMREVNPARVVPPSFPLAAAALAPLRVKAERNGSADFSPLWCGQNATGCKAIPAAQLARQLAGV